MAMITGCAQPQTKQSQVNGDMRSQRELYAALDARSDLARATFAGGCFWCMEGPFEALDGVVEAFAGYAGGTEENPSYAQVAGGQTGHHESVQVFYDPTQVSYETLLETYWHQIDPTDSEGQFADRGSQYVPAIFYHTDAQKVAAEQSRAALAASGKFDKEIVVPIVPFSTFYLAEDAHQDYYKNKPGRYHRYKEGSGRADFIRRTWEAETFYKPSDEELRKTLTPLQYKVTQKEGTERPFKNAYWNNHEAGIYVDIISGEPLFSSTDKFDSGTGWPSFLKPISESAVTKRKDYKLIIPRIEIRSAIADSHLGHIIMDGPASNDGVRYCMNSAALRFVPVADMEKEGYGKWLHLFGNATMAK